MDKILSFLFVILICCVISHQEECRSLRISEYKDLVKLENCTAILGNLYLSIPTLEFDSSYESNLGYTSAMMNNRSFPLLYEITGFFGVTSMTHLDSLGSMFPELRVIRGRRLLSNFAFFIYDSDIREVIFML